MANELYELIEDTTLIDSLKRKERAGYELLYDLYASRIFGIIQKIICNDTLAEALLIATFVELSKTIPEFNPEKERLYTRLINISRNLCFKKLETLPPKLESHTGVNKSKLELIYFHGMTATEIANELNIPVDVVKKEIRIELIAHKLLLDK